MELESATDAGRSTMNATEREQEDFSPALGGPFYQLLLRSGLLRAPLDLWQRRMIVFAAITWLPLFALTTFEGTLVGGVPVPFLIDFAPSTRFLVAIPILIGAEVIVHDRIRTVIRQFRIRGMFAPEVEGRAIGIAHSAMRWRNSYVIEALLIITALTGGHLYWRDVAALHVGTWYATGAEHGGALTTAGWWYAWVSLPILRFILFRWYFRVLIWYVLLFRLARLPLRLNPLHPDRAGGIGFLEGSLMAFAPLLLAHTIVLSGGIANHIFHEGAKLPQYRMEIAGFLLGLIAVPWIPLFFFAPQLGRARRRGLREYGSLASLYVNDFARKWALMREASESNPGRGDSTIGSADSLLGTADIQSLADLGNSFETVRQMGIVPVGRKAVVHLLVLLALPFAPLLLTMFPIETIFDQAVKMVF